MMRYHHHQMSYTHGQHPYRLRQKQRMIPQEQLLHDPGRLQTMEASSSLHEELEQRQTMKSTTHHHQHQHQLHLLDGTPAPVGPAAAMRNHSQMGLMLTSQAKVLLLLLLQPLVLQSWRLRWRWW